MKKLFNATLIFKHFDCVTRLSLTKKFVDHRSWLRKCDNFPASFTAQVRLGYLDVAMQKKNCETCMPSCAIDSQQRLFRCSHSEKFFVSETRKKRLRKYLVSESWGAPSSKGNFPTYLVCPIWTHRYAYYY